MVVDMRVIKSGEKHFTCTKCHSVIGVMPHEVSTVSPLGPYDDDYEDVPNIGRKYWSCPVCHHGRNYVSSSTSEVEDDSGY